MADLTDVLNALIAIAAQAVYPSGTSQPSVAATPVKIYPGWPIGGILDTDLPVGTCHISIYPRDEETNTSRYMANWNQQTLGTPTLTATILNNTVTIGGTVSSPQNVTILVNGKAYSYGVQATDTLTTIATALAALIVIDVAGTTSAGAVITFPTTARIAAARIGASATIIREWRRQKKSFQVTVWADTPAHRDAIATPLDLAISLNQFLTMPDGYAARLIYKNSHLSDQLSKARIYRRDLFYLVEYATTQTDSAVEITSIQENISAMDSTGTTISPITTVVT